MAPKEQEQKKVKMPRLKGANVIYKCLTILHLRGTVEIVVRFVESEH